MKLLVGLGNPGKEYEQTRHNIGFKTLELFATRHQIEIVKKKFSGLYGEGSIGTEKVILLKPQSYINLSGEVIRKFVDFFKIPLEDVLIIHDDLDLPVGKFKLKENGSSGGHNGLKNIELHFHTQHYRRLKIGISNDKSIETKDYVLGKLSLSEQAELKKVQDVLQNLLDDYFEYDFSKLMNLYNGLPR